MSDKAKSSRWLKFALAGSLCVNLLVLGVIGGAVLRGKPDKRVNFGNDPIRAIYRSLPREERRTLTKSVRSAERPKQERGAWVETFLTQMRSESFDEESLTMLFASRNDVMVDFAKRGQTALVELFGKMSTQERQAFATRFEENWQKRPKRHRR